MSRKPVPLDLVACAVVAAAILLVLLRRWTDTSPVSSGNPKELTHFDGAVSTDYSTPLAHNPALFARAEEALEHGDVATAERLYRQAIAEFPKNPDGYNALGSTLYFQQRYDEAYAVYMKASAIDQKSAVALYGLGSVAFARKDFALCKQHVQQALQLRPDDGYFHRLIGMACDGLGEIPEAITHYRRALANLPNGDTALEERLRSLAP
jgi:tetratricopeptide (TPR) repeat protein